ncbi:MAG: hypothetical protein AB1779_08445 [Candidatus Thermoplasmatota archaeon]
MIQSQIFGFEVGKIIAFYESLRYSSVDVRIDFLYSRIPIAIAVNPPIETKRTPPQYANLIIYLSTYPIFEIYGSKNKNVMKIYNEYIPQNLKEWFANLLRQHNLVPIEYGKGFRLAYYPLGILGIAIGIFIGIISLVGVV